MTLRAYHAADFDALALRALDLAAGWRRMARRTRGEPLETAALNDKKALEWLEKLEQWSEKAEAGLELQILRARAAAAARPRIEVPARPPAGAQKRRKK